jgi:hypothetical protein
MYCLSYSWMIVLMVVVTTGYLQNYCEAVPWETHQVNHTDC